jgi:hypothetical protein
MNNNQYYRAGKTVLGWKQLSIAMKARYAHWIILSTSSWTVHYHVVITHRNGRKLKDNKQPTYPFERKVDAEECQKWWEDNNCTAEIRKV